MSDKPSVLLVDDDVDLVDYKEFQNAFNGPSP